MWLAVKRYLDMVEVTSSSLVSPTSISAGFRRLVIRSKMLTGAILAHFVMFLNDCSSIPCTNTENS